MIEASFYGLDQPVLGYLNVRAQGAQLAVWVF